MEGWKRSLYILCIGQFLAMASISCVAPFLPLYLQELGVQDHADVTMWSAVIYGANLLSAFVMAPVWGRLADRYGRKLMLLRSGFGMAVTMTLMAFVSGPVELLLLRLLNGTLSGFGPAAIALTAKSAPKERSGYALGMLHSSSVGGTICGPLLGGMLADRFGFAEVFLYMGIGILAASVVVLFGVHERYEKPLLQAQTSGLRGDLREMMSRRPLLHVFVSAFLQRAATVGILPLIPLYVQLLAPGSSNVALLAGIASAAAGVANMMAAPQLGKLGDRRGPSRVLASSLLGAMLLAIPQAFAQQLWQLIALRFCSGASLSGLGLSLNSLVRRHAPAGMESRAYSYLNCAQMAGGLLGSIGMGWLAGAFGLRIIFAGSAVLLALNWLWVKITDAHVSETDGARQETADLSSDKEAWEGQPQQTGSVGKR
ncbi:MULTISPECIES: MFS transporter [unclassified Paenibacillus]|uniref:MFS transporter n=1 Tax=unclassified Paenibacillus TaxID=185978 RepID=UPI000BA60C1E|nr:MFS transporter [Paenibacillus sp. 7541]PAK55937.1 MFS transporter [Paenibacillus sp. 7541]